MKHRTIQLTAATLVLLAALAGTLTIPDGPFQVGQVVKITYDNPAMAGKTVTVSMNDGAIPVPKRAGIEIKLDKNGKGSTSWTIPAWEGAFIHGPAGEPVQTRIFLP